MRIASSSSLNLAELLAELVGVALLTTSCNLIGETSCSDAPDDRAVTLSTDRACAEARASGNVSAYTNKVAVSCDAVGCGEHGSCVFEDAYERAVRPLVTRLRADGGTEEEELACPEWDRPVKVHCSTFCEGRRTLGVPEPVIAGEGSVAEYFATCSYLEAVSVHAFRRLHAELAAYGAPAALLARVARAAEEEITHAALTAELAAAYGASGIASPEPPPSEVRPLVAIAIENAVEGCVRETYGAALALARARRAQDGRVREAVERIAQDECAHAELSYAVAAWLSPRLSAEERSRVTAAVKAAVAELLEDARTSSTEPEIARVAGLATAEERVSLARLIDRHVVAPALALPS